jgi:mercuric ion transport protein
VEKNKVDKIMGIGIIGSIVTAICCFTPILVILLGLIGLSALTGYLDYVLLPALGVFLILMAYGGYLEKKTGQKACAPYNKEDKSER